MTDRELFDLETSEEGLTGVRVGIVTDNEDPKDLGRVKLSFPWREADDESYWARIATAMAGNEYGTYFLPEVDSEVLVAFEGGDIHKPFVVGSLWNGKQKPPQKNKNGDNNVREIKSRSGHRIDLDDSKDGRVAIETSAGHRIVLDDKSGSEKVTVEGKSGKNSITLDDANGEVAIQAGKKLTLDAKTINIKGKKQVSVSGKSGLDLSSKSKLNVSSNGQLNVSGKLMGIKATGPLTIKGKIIQLN